MYFAYYVKYETYIFNMYVSQEIIVPVDIKRDIYWDFFETLYVFEFVMYEIIIWIPPQII